MLRKRGGRRLQLNCIKLNLAKAQGGQDHFQGGGGEMPPSNPLEKTLPVYMRHVARGRL